MKYVHYIEFFWLQLLHNAQCTAKSIILQFYVFILCTQLSIKSLNRKPVPFERNWFFVYKKKINGNSFALN